MFFLWILSIIATILIADQKKLNPLGYFLLALVTGPIAVIVVLLVPKRAYPSEKIGGAVHNIEDAKIQLNRLKSYQRTLQQRIENLEQSLTDLAGDKPAGIEKDTARKTVESDLPEKTKVAEKDTVPITDTGGRKEENQKEKFADFELDFGRNWLNRIGIIIFTLGMGFLISYAFKYFGPLLKILTGYAVSALLFFAGFKLEAKEKFANFGRVLLGGGWALVYFTTYAMHHFDASRIIQSQLIDVGLLAVVAGGMIIHSLKYKSETTLSLALVVAYVTTTMGQITAFTFTGTLMLAAVVLFLVYRLQWVRPLFLGMVLTYGIHQIWVVPNIAASARQMAIDIDWAPAMNFLFLSAYCLVFCAGIHLARNVKDFNVRGLLAGVNFGNIALYSVLAYPLILKLYHPYRFGIVLGIGVVFLLLALLMKRAGRDKLYISDIVAAVFAITFAISLKFTSTGTLLLWLVEIPFLLFIGLRLKERIFSYMSYVLTFVTGLRLMNVCFYGRMADVSFFGFLWTWQEFMLLWTAVSMAVCFYLTHGQRDKEESDAADEIFDHVFPAASAASLTWLLWSVVEQPWKTLVFFAEGLALLFTSLGFNLQRFRAYAYLVFALGAGIFLFDPVKASPKALQWLIVIFDTACFFGAYALMKFVVRRKSAESLFASEEILPFWGGIVLLIFAVFEYVASPWISLSLGIAGVLMALIGLLGGDKTERMGGMLLLGLTLVRVVTVDIAGLNAIFKIVTFIGLGVLFLGLSFIYNRFNVSQDKE